MSSESDKGGFRGYFEWFVHSEVTGSILLLACTVVALVWANSPWADSYVEVLHTYVGVSWGEAAFKLSLHHWINDGLMVVFFFVVGLEIKRELVVGELSSFNKAALPVAAAIGGMVVPALLFFALNTGGEGARGWGIPMATDIAFALGVLAIFGTRAPLGLKVFLTALAIADDLGAVAVIAIFFTEKINVLPLVVATVLLALLFTSVQMRMRKGILYLLIVGVWVAVFSSGIHATVAGILMAMVIPVRPRVDPHRFIDDTEERLERFKKMELGEHSLISDHEQLEIVESIHSRAEDTLPAGLVLEHYLHPVQVWLILPLFALANAGVAIGGDLMAVLANWPGGWKAGRHRPLELACGQERSRGPSRGSDVGAGRRRRLSGRDRLHHVALHQRPRLRQRDVDRDRQDRHPRGVIDVRNSGLHHSLEVVAKGITCELGRPCRGTECTHPPIHPGAECRSHPPILERKSGFWGG
jgi:NhaA family Na+:H+ antiporter